MRKVVFAALSLAVTSSPPPGLPVVRDYGTHSIFQPHLTSQPDGFPRLHTVTAYCLCKVCCGQWAKYGRTAIGTMPREGRTVAGDPKVWRMRGCVEVFGIGKRRVEDTGSAIMGDKLDIFMLDHGRAREFGRQTLLVGRC